MTDTQHWPFIPAKHFTKVPASQPRTVRLIVIHSAEFPERENAAEGIARYFQNPDKPSSAHLCIDNNSIIQCVYDRDVAYAAPGCNSDGIQIELAGYGKQSESEWRDFYGIALLALASDAVAQYAIKFDIPLVHLTNAQLKAGKRGIIGHAQASAVYKRSDHTDPGEGFPWSYFLASAQLFYEERTRKSA